ncbi:AN1-type zinc finger domain-containing protein [Halomarina litorea]|uniref:AN1-type zinc finger domain-containing protein n=1 Tax=Halomarina litorea TaxID=2961595 RepID=UPI0020C50B94|nr:AN1-type zinc finger domain-containing protein [Halomarina sp. BCD28]
MALDAVDGEPPEGRRSTVAEGDLERLRAEVDAGALAETLNELDAGGFVGREVEAGSPPRVAYSLGERGDRALRDWRLYRSGVVTCRRCGDRLHDVRGCSYCSGTYCSTHRLPENHDCPGIE